MNKLPTATRVSQTPSSTKWRIELPSTPRKAGKVYFATTYADSQLIYVTTGANQRPIAKGVGRKLHPKIRAAIDAVLAVELPLTVAGASLGKSTAPSVAAIPASALVEMFNAVPPVGPIE